MNPLSYSISAQAKALVAALVAGLTYLQANLPDGITPEEWVGTAIATLVAYGTVFGVPNRSR